MFSHLKSGGNGGKFLILHNFVFISWADEKSI